MARQAANDGIEAICATPHIRHDHDVRIHEVGGRVAALNRRLRGEEIPVRVLAGGEVAATAVAALSDEDLASVALGDGRWVLLEPAPGPLDDRLSRCVGQLGDRGYRALIAHPERHLSADMFDRIAGLIEDQAHSMEAISHDLRTPLARIQLAAQFAEPEDVRDLPISVVERFTEDVRGPFRR